MVIGVLARVEDRQLQPRKVEWEEDAPALLRHEPAHLDVVVAVYTDDAGRRPLHDAEHDGHHGCGDKQAIVGCACERAEGGRKGRSRADSIPCRQIATLGAASRERGRKTAKPGMRTTARPVPMIDRRGPGAPAVPFRRTAGTSAAGTLAAGMILQAAEHVKAFHPSNDVNPSE